MVYQLCALGISTKKETLLQLSNWLSGISMSTDILSFHQLTMGISTQVCYNSIFFVKDLWGSFLCLFIYNNYDNIIFSLHPLTLCPEIFILLPNVKNKNTTKLEYCPGCALRKMLVSGVLWTCEIQTAEHYDFYEKAKVFYSPRVQKLGARGHWALLEHSLDSSHTCTWTLALKGFFYILNGAGL